MARRKKFVPPKHAIQVSPEVLSDTHDLVRASVTKKELIETFGYARGPKGTGVTELPGGKWNCHLNGQKANDLFDEMDRKRCEIDERIGERMAARESTETLIGPNGEAMTVVDHHAEHVATVKGLKPRIRWGRPSYVSRVVNGELVRETTAHGAAIRGAR